MSAATKRRILLVDDTDMALRATSRILSAMGYGVATCAGPIEALELLGQSWIDCVVTDWDMPDGGGAVVLAACHHCAIPVVVYTGDVETVEALERRCVVAVLKPSTMPTLQAAIARAIAAAGKRRSA
jgi:DNA-binding NtrC family response regulator